ncbi:MAG: 50S ribosomal protein L31 [Gammaproteobacteria bacterium]|nr:50S ribosomal protein L31 [Gammaproteobacteria bacterium]
MKKDIHPTQNKITATCFCGNGKYEILSTLKEDISLEVCAKCHPFFTGEQRIMDRAGRVEKFQKRFGKKLVSDSPANAPAAAPAKDSVAAPASTPTEAPAETATDSAPAS